MFLSSFILLCVAICCFYLYHILERSRKLHLDGLQLVSPEKSGDFRDTLAKASRKYPDRPYVAAFQDPTVIIPANCIEELKNLPDSQLSTNGSMYERFAIRWTGSGWVDKELAHSMRYSLASEIDGFFGTIQDEIKYATGNFLPNSTAWEAVAPQEALSKVMGLVIGRLIVGNPVNRDPKWLNASVDHATAVVVYSTWLRQFPSILRPIVAHFLPQKKAVEKSKREIRETIGPMVSEFSRMNEIKDDQLERGRLVRWLLKRYKSKGNGTDHETNIMRDHYSLCFAAIHGPTFLLIQALIDLASHPSYIDLLRQEIDRELSIAPFEEWTRATIGRMQFLDAFCKESARMNPQGVIAWLRKTHQPIKLSTGHTIPADTLIAATNPRFDSAAHPWIVDREVFCPERWLPCKDSSIPEASRNFGSASIDSLIFGYGKHACPGRPFGVTMLKDTLAYIVAKWDIRLAGQGGRRPENISIDFVLMPPIAPLGNLEIEFKKRDKEASKLDRT